MSLADRLEAAADALGPDRQWTLEPAELAEPLAAWLRSAARSRRAAELAVEKTNADSYVTEKITVGQIDLDTPLALPVADVIVVEAARPGPTLADELLDLAVQWEERAAELDGKCDVEPREMPDDEDDDDGLDEFGIRDLVVEADALRKAAKQLRDLLRAEAGR